MDASPVAIRRGEGAQRKQCRGPRCSPRGNPACRGTFAQKQRARPAPQLSFVTPWTAAHQASLSITNSRSLLKLMSTLMGKPSVLEMAPPRGRREPHPPGDLVPGEGDVTHTARRRAAKAKPPRCPGRPISPRASPQPPRPLQLQQPGHELCDPVPVTSPLRDYSFSK